jgi:hypothetical protein
MNSNFQFSQVYKADYIDPITGDKSLVALKKLILWNPQDGVGWFVFKILVSNNCSSWDNFTEKVKAHKHCRDSRNFPEQRYVVYSI